MREPPLFRFADLLILLLIIAVAAGVRSWYLWDAVDSGAANAPVRVQEEDQTRLTEEVNSLRDQDGFAAHAPLGAHKEQTAYSAPGYAYALYLVDKIQGDRDQLMRWIQVGLGALTAGLYFLFAYRAFHCRGVAVLAGLFCALHPFWIAATAEIADGVLASFLLALALCLGARGSQTGGALTSLLFGVALAALALVRAALLPFGFIAILWFLVRCRRIPRGWIAALLAFLGFVNGLVPWAIRNYQTFHEILPIVDSTYYHLWVGNTPHGERAAVQTRELADLPEDKRYRELSGPFWLGVREDPAGTLNRRLWASLEFFFGENWLRQRVHGEQFFNDASWLAGSLPTIFTATLVAMLLLGLLGWRWSAAWRWESMPAALAAVWIFLPYMLSHSDALYGPRLPLDGVILCYVAFALVGLVPGFGADLRNPTEAGDAVHENPLR